MTLAVITPERVVEELCKVFFGTNIQVGEKVYIIPKIVMGEGHYIVLLGFN